MYGGPGTHGGNLAHTAEHGTREGCHYISTDHIDFIEGHGTRKGCHYTSTDVSLRFLKRHVTNMGMRFHIPIVHQGKDGRVGVSR